MRFFKARPLDSGAEATPAEAIDPPFVYRVPLRDNARHVVNDVYVRNPTGKKWHRVYRGDRRDRLSSMLRAPQAGRVPPFVR